MPRLAAICGYFVALLVLCALTWALWQWRFVALPDSPALTLGNTPPWVARSLEGPAVVDESGRLSMPAGQKAPEMHYLWTREPASRHALISFKASCRGVKVGKLRWQDARIILLWVDGDGKMVSDHLPLWSGRGDLPAEEKQMIVTFARGGTRPMLVVQNLGSAGDFAVENFVVQAVVPRPGIPIATAAVIAGWILWVGLGMRWWIVRGNRGRLRLTAATMLWVGFAWVYCLPGLWVYWPPLCASYPIKAVPPPPPKPVPPPVFRPPPATTPQIPESAPGVPPAPPAPVPSNEPAGKEQAPTSGPPEKMKGAEMRWLFNTLHFLKRPLHFMLFAGLGFFLALFTGSPRAIWPTVAMGGISEFCQWALGFGFDASDVLDLVLDVAAALVGLMIWRLLARRGRQRQWSEATQGAGS